VRREVAFAGDGGRLTIGVVRYEFHEDASGSEANWLKGGVKVELSATGAFRCSCPVLFMELDRGQAALGGYVKVGGFARLEFEGITTDEASLRKAHGELVELVREFPVRAGT
jgi:hypothetical protein